MVPVLCVYGGHPECKHNVMDVCVWMFRLPGNSLSFAAAYNCTFIFKKL